ncbi:hypothetical protein GFL93_20850 [Rhizobium leguminosarum bv. viciae]|uniref:Uncharacterized protein n=1 Tax=Rhizobium leguminosarum bv. viciae TaxID=387 RepID=A0A8G2IYM6_RHILV|nr:hypothetical protein [Rhizobium leguminosarum bv. viciae]NKK22038.1 hypothetical protein [Rhizobium leguminosarum bv. viciae]TBX93826.1 hypothetical protein E0H31_15105 [Rhizobium leguminosarum bv. viciae]TBZ17117.1 hypothetical protein E0H52_19490 [Rhizobium leguminosarum bv. viciae]
MFPALASLSDHDIDVVVDAVTEWCSQHHCDIQSCRGQFALAVAVDAVQSSANYVTLLQHLSEKLLSRV